MIRIPLAATCFLSLLMALAIIMALIVISLCGVQQCSARITEKDFNRNLPFRNAAIELWGGLRYHLFHTGSKRVVIGKDGWLFTAEEFEVSKDFEQNLQANIDFILKAKEQLNRQDIILIVALVPSKAQLRDQPVPAPRAALRERILAALPREIVVVPREEITFPRTDTHWTAEGARVMAESVAAHLRRFHPALAASFNTAYKTRPMGVFLHKGDLTPYVPGAGIPAERIQRWETQADLPPNLFSDPKIPVALVGTSYSADEDWHFTGFLQQALHTDVLNLAKQSIGPIAPMRKFLCIPKSPQDLGISAQGAARSVGDWGSIPGRTECSKHNIPAATRLVIWEFPERYLGVAP